MVKENELWWIMIMIMVRKKMNTNVPHSLEGFEFFRLWKLPLSWGTGLNVIGA